MWGAGVIAFALFVLAVLQGITINRLGGIMVNQDTINASINRLTAAVDKVVAAQATQTPDTVVNATLNLVDAQSARLESAAPQA